MPLLTILIVTSLSLVLALGCEKKPPESKYIGGDSAPPATSPAEAPPTGQSPVPAIAIAGLSLSPDPSWRAEAPTSAMRKAQYTVGNIADPAQIVVFHFGAGQGGGVESNLVRWARLVLDENNQPTLPQIEEQDVGPLHITLATFTGTYMAGAPGGEKTPKPNWTLIAGVIENGPNGTLYPRLVGPSAVVDSARESFVRFVKSAAVTP